jgi:hypothetical protein
MPYLIDEPSPFAPASEWKEHLADLAKLDQSALEVRQAMEREWATLRQIEASALCLNRSWPDAASRPARGYRRDR